MAESVEFTVKRESIGEKRVPRGDRVNESEAFVGDGEDGVLDVASDGEDVLKCFKWSEKWLMGLFMNHVFFLILLFCLCIFNLWINVCVHFFACMFVYFFVFLQKNWIKY